ncbi:CbtB domain-containing protein [Salininema proteolyticum]|uniref:CbtB domain-containing protein n=1 Tax=Salininema proteolyticum TaxID=1607685 RepID=A0ABV8U5Y4_9ACTN
MTAISAAAASPRRILITALSVVLFAAVLYAVGFEQGTLTGGTPWLHEAFHDARHLLGFPCH